MQYTAQGFWNWFEANSNNYLFVNQVEEEERERLFDLLLEQLHLYCDNLWFEIGGYPDEKQELVITAEGDTAYFDKVTELVNQAPDFKHWAIVAFKPPLGPGFRIRFEDVELSPDEMWFLPLSNPEIPTSIGLRVCIKNYESVKDSEWLESTVAKVLDMVLGEVSYALDIDYVEIDQLPDEPEEEDMMQLVELPSYVEWHKKQEFEV